MVNEKIYKEDNHMSFRRLVILHSDVVLIVKFDRHVVGKDTNKRNVQRVH